MSIESVMLSIHLILCHPLLLLLSIFTSIRNPWTVWKGFHRSAYNYRIHWLWASLVVQVIKNPVAKAGDARDMDSVPGLGRSPGGRNGNPLQYSCLENCTDRWAWWATVHGITKSRIPLSTHNTMHHWLILKVFLDTLKYLHELFNISFTKWSWIICYWNCISVCEKNSTGTSDSTITLFLSQQDKKQTQI